MNALPVVRGCGVRAKGGVYWELGFSAHGKPIEAFLLDPPIPADIEKLNISPIGVHLIEREGVWHVVDWIGSIHYENVTDFLEEVRRYGVSRRLELTEEQYKMLSQNSRLLAVHVAGIIESPQMYWSERMGQQNSVIEEGYQYDWNLCPKGNEQHQAGAGGKPMCAGLWWEDVLGVEPLIEGSRLGRRKMPAFEYFAAAPPNEPEVEHTPAFIASFPLGRIVVIADPDNGTHEDKMKKLSNLQDGIEVDLVEE